MEQRQNIRPEGKKGSMKKLCKNKWLVIDINKKELFFW